MKKSVCIGLLLLGVGATAALADIVSDRQDLMKSFGGTGRVLGGMARGTTPYDAAAANVQLQIIVNGAAKIPTMFPAGSNTPPTLALPTVWSDSAGFQAAAAKLGADAQAAMTATDTASFTTTYATVQGDCNACHKVYRAPPPPRPAAPPAAPAQ